MRHHEIELASEPLTRELLAAQDAVLVVTDHDAIEWTLVAEHARLIVDTRNRLSRLPDVRGKVVPA